ISANTQLGGWTVTDPNYSGAGFNATNGTYTVPSTGKYSIKAVISYTTTAALSVNLGSGVNPAFVIRKITPTNTPLVSGLFPILNVNIALLLTLRAVLVNGSITLAEDVHLNAGDTVVIFYQANGLTINLN